MKNLAIFGCTLFCFFAGCATQYQKVGFTGGFNEKQLARNEFVIAFSGNGYTTGQRAIDLCMLRCAEITLGHGFHYFILTANNAGYDTSTSITTGNYISTGYGNGFYFSTTQAIPKPSAANRILCFRQKPTTTTDYYDAQNTFDELSQKYYVHKDVESFPQFRLPIATVGIRLGSVERPSANQVHPGANTKPVTEGNPQFKIQSFVEGNLAQAAGLQIGDEITAFDGVVISNLDDIGEITSSWQIGEVVQVTVHRHGDDIIVPVKTIFNPVMRFKQTKEIKFDEPISENDVVVIENARPTVAAFPVAEYADWENPVESDSELRRYLVMAARNNGVNGVLILNSAEEVKNIYPNADARIGFLCSLLIVPKARLGVEFETGTGYENRRVIRRVLNPESDGTGLHIGDNVLAINGIDPVLNSSDAIKDCMKWSVGQEVQVTVARDGKEITLPVKTTENRE